MTIFVWQSSGALENNFLTNLQRYCPSLHSISYPRSFQASLTWLIHVGLYEWSRGLCIQRQWAADVVMPQMLLLHGATALLMTAVGPRTNHIVRPGTVQRWRNGKNFDPLSVRGSRGICPIHRLEISTWTCTQVKNLFLVCRQ